MLLITASRATFRYRLLLPFIAVTFAAAVVVRAVAVQNQAVTAAAMEG